MRGVACYPSLFLLEPSLASPLPVCPFCKGAIPADTLRFGGNCPHCMLEIPGEEAPTDPGLQARLRKEQEDKVLLAQKQRKSRIYGALGLVVLLGLSGVGVVAYQAQKEALTYEMDDYYATPLSELQTAAPVPVAETPSAVDPATATAAANGRPTGRKSTAPTIGSGATPSTGGPARPSYKSGSDEPPPELSSASGSVGGGTGAGSIKVGYVGTDKVLTDNDEIFAMAKAVINASSPQLTGCYNNRLKQVEGLKGAWEVAFTIGRDGVAKSVRVTGVNGADAELERCMSQSVSSWKFQRIVKDQPVKKTYRFGAGGW